MAMEAECAVCLQLYDDEEDRTPRVLSCGHSVCHSCLADLRTHWGGGRDESRDFVSRSGLVQCPECKQHTRIPLQGGLAAVPRNIELMRLIQGRESARFTEGKQVARRIQRVRETGDLTRPWPVAQFSYGEPVIWVLPESSVRTRKGFAGGFCVGEFVGEATTLEWQSVSVEFLVQIDDGDDTTKQYKERVQLGWESLRGEIRYKLMRLIGLSFRCNYFAEVVGLWASEDGGLYLVSKVWEEGVEQARRLMMRGSDGGGGGVEGGGGGGGRSVSGRTLIRLGLEVCELVMEIHAGGVQVGVVLGVDSFVLDAYGHLRLLVGRCVVSSRRRSGVNECVFSPEKVVEGMKKLEGYETISSSSSCGSEDDVYSLGCDLLQLLSHQEEVLDRNERFKELLLSCVANVPSSSRPRVVDLWWELKGLLEDQALGGTPSHFAEEDSSKDKPGQEMTEPEAIPVEPPSVPRALIDVEHCNNTGGVKTLRGHMDTVSCLSVCGNYLISASFDKNLRVWSLDDYRLVRTFKGHEQRITAVAVHEASELCMSGDYGGQICAWNVASTGNAAPVATWQVHQDWRYSGVASLAISGDELLYCGSGDRTIKAWSTLGFEHVATMEGHKGVVSVLMVEGQILFSGSWDGTIRLWWRPDHSPLTNFGEGSSVPLGGIRALVKCPANGLLFSGHDSGVIQIWNEEECVSTLKAHTGVVSALALDQDWLYSSSWDGFVKAWPLEDILTGTSDPVERKCNQAAVTALCCSGQDKLFIAVKQEIQVFGH